MLFFTFQDFLPSPRRLYLDLCKKLNITLPSAFFPLPHREWPLWPPSWIRHEVGFKWEFHKEVLAASLGTRHSGPTSWSMVSRGSPVFSAPGGERYLGSWMCGYISARSTNEDFDVFTLNCVWCDSIFPQSLLSITFRAHFCFICFSTSLSRNNNFSTFWHLFMNFLFVYGIFQSRRVFAWFTNSAPFLYILIHLNTHTQLFHVYRIRPLGWCGNAPSAATQSSDADAAVKRDDHEKVWFKSRSCLWKHSCFKVGLKFNPPPKTVEL